jgi:large subunit ribosomal protein L18
MSNELKRKQRNRKKIKLNNSKPRLSVFRSNKYIYAQIIDDRAGETLASFSSQKVKKSGIDAAKEVGKEIAKLASKNNVEEVVFDRGPYKYHGKVKALAESARENGLKF